MKGPPIPLAVPIRGAIRNTPPHRVPPDAVVDGQNMLVTLDGKYGCRPGYAAYGAQGGLLEAPRGGIFFRDPAQTSRIVVGGPTAWATYDVTTDAWVDITPAGDPLSGGIDDPVRFTTFAQAGAVWVVGANDTNRLKRWEPTLAEYVDIAAAPIARDLTTLANRIVTVNTIESDVRQQARIRWSSAVDATSWPALSFNDLDAGGDPNIGIEPLTRFSAVIYRERSIWILHAQDGGDATAFAPERVSSDTDGPVSPAAIVRSRRAHYYFGRDNKVYRFDGVEPVVISTPIDGLLNEIISPAYWDKMHGVYYTRRREIWWWVVRRGETEPRSAFVYNIDAQRWEVEQRFSIGVTASVRAEDNRAGSWAADPNPWESDTTTWEQETGEPYLVIMLGADTGRVHAFGDANADDGAAINFSWRLPLAYRGEVARLIAERVESFFEPATTNTSSVTVNVYGVAQPGSAPVLQYSGAVNVASLSRLVNSMGDTAFDTSNYSPGLQVEYSGSTSNHKLLRWSGGTLSAYEEVDG